jgi:hypothetical protein
MRGLRGWRSTIAAAAIGVLIFGLGVVLRVAGLGAAANVAVLVSLAPLITSLTGWAKNRHRVKEPAGDRSITFADLLRTIADAHGLTSHDLRERLPGWSDDVINAYFDGGRHPDWGFVTAFLDVVAEDDRWRREVLERRLRPAWETASISTPHDVVRSGGIAGQATVIPQFNDWIAAMRSVASARKFVTNSTVSIIRHEDLGIHLAEMLDRLSVAVTSLTTDCDSLRAQLAAQYRSVGIEHNTGPHTEIEDLRRALLDTQQRLERAEHLRRETARRLEISELQRLLAERLRDQAVAQAEDAWKRLVQLEQNPARASSRQSVISLNADAPQDSLMGETDQQLAEEILARVDHMLSDEAEALRLLKVDLAKIPMPNSASREALQSPFRFRKAAAWFGMITVAGATVAIILALANAGPSGQASKYSNFAFWPASLRGVGWCHAFYGTGAIPKGDALLIFSSTPGSGQFDYQGEARMTSLTNTWSIGPVYIGSRNDIGLRVALSGVLVSDATAQFVDSEIVYGPDGGRRIGGT